MIERAHDELGLWPERLIADTGYGSAEMLNWLVHERGIEPRIPVFDKSKRKDDTFSRDDFTYDHKVDTYLCAGGKTFGQRRKTYRVPHPLDGMMGYRASKLDCDACALKPSCCPKEPARKELRSIYEGARYMARDIAKADAYQTSRYQHFPRGTAFSAANASRLPKPGASALAALRHAATVRIGRMRLIFR